MKSDSNIQKQIQKALDSNPFLEGCAITVEVLNGQAFLSGYVNLYCKKEAARKTAKEVEGTRLVREALEIVFPQNLQASDAAIEAEIQSKFVKNFGNAHKNIQVTVRNGQVWLEGRLNWKYQKDLAVECISCINGLKGIENHIFIPETQSSTVSEKDVLAAIYGDHSITSDIRVEVFGHKVILKGAVSHTNQKNLITRLVRRVAGVSEVENFIIVGKSV